MVLEGIPLPEVIFWHRSRDLGFPSSAAQMGSPKWHRAPPTPPARRAPDPLGVFGYSSVCLTPNPSPAAPNPLFFSPRPGGSQHQRAAAVGALPVPGLSPGGARTPPPHAEGPRHHHLHPWAVVEPIILERKDDDLVFPSLSRWKDGVAAAGSAEEGGGQELCHLAAPPSPPCCPGPPPAPHVGMGSP